MIVIEGHFLTLSSLYPTVILKAFPWKVFSHAAALVLCCKWNLKYSFLISCLSIHFWDRAFRICVSCSLCNSCTDCGNLHCCDYLDTQHPASKAAILTQPRITITSQVPHYLHHGMLTCWVLKKSPLSRRGEYRT